MCYEEPAPTSACKIQQKLLLPCVCCWNAQEEVGWNLAHLHIFQTAVRENQCPAHSDHWCCIEGTKSGAFEPQPISSGCTINATCRQGHWCEFMTVRCLTEAVKLITKTNKQLLSARFSLQYCRFSSGSIRDRYLCKDYSAPSFCLQAMEHF